MNGRQRIGIAVVERNGHVLVGQRGADPPLGGMAEFPGGKCNIDEDSSCCAVRECREETGLDVTATDLLACVAWSYDHGDLELHFWRCRLNAGSADKAPLPPFRWVAVAELDSLTFPPANRAVILLLQDGSV